MGWTSLYVSVILIIIAGFNVHNVLAVDDKVTAQVVSVYDGDTIKVDIDGWPAIIGERISIRVAGVDTPEIRGKCSREKRLAKKAKKFTTKFVSNGTVELSDISRGKYFRLVAEVFVNGESLSKALLRKGLAYPYSGGTKEGWCD